MNTEDWKEVGVNEEADPMGSFIWGTKGRLWVGPGSLYSFPLGRRLLFPNARRRRKRANPSSLRQNSPPDAEDVLPARFCTAKEPLPTFANQSL